MDEGAAALAAANSLVTNALRVGLNETLNALVSGKVTAVLLGLCVAIIVTERVFTKNGLLLLATVVELLVSFTLINIALSPFLPNQPLKRPLLAFTLCFASGVLTPEWILHHTIANRKPE